MNWVHWTVKGILAAKVLFWVIFIVVAIYWASAIGQGVSDLFHGITARIDHSIGYEAE